MDAPVRPWGIPGYRISLQNPHCLVRVRPVRIQSLKCTLAKCVRNEFFSQRGKCTATSTMPLPQFKVHRCTFPCNLCKFLLLYLNTIDELDSEECLVVLSYKILEIISDFMLWGFIFGQLLDHFRNLKLSGLSWLSAALLFVPREQIFTLQRKEIGGLALVPALPGVAGPQYAY